MVQEDRNELLMREWCEPNDDDLQHPAVGTESNPCRPVDGYAERTQVVEIADTAKKATCRPNRVAKAEGGVTPGLSRRQDCKCRQEIWARAGPLPIHSKQLRGKCPCCIPRQSKNVSIPLQLGVKAETCKPQNLSQDKDILPTGVKLDKLPQLRLKACTERPFWWWCHDERSQLPVGDINEYATTHMEKPYKIDPPYNEILGVDNENNYLPGEIHTGEKPDHYKFVQECPVSYIRPFKRAKCPEHAGCSRHGYTTKPTQGEPYIRDKVLLTQPFVCNNNDVFASGSECRQQKNSHSYARLGWRGWPGVPTKWQTYSSLSPDKCKQRVTE